MRDNSVVRRATSEQRARDGKERDDGMTCVCHALSLVIVLPASTIRSDVGSGFRKIQEYSGSSEDAGLTCQEGKNVNREVEDEGSGGKRERDRWRREERVCLLLINRRRNRKTSVEE